MPGHRPVSGPASSSASAQAPRDEARARAPTLAHMVIFNPTLARKSSKADKAGKGETDKSGGAEDKARPGDEGAALPSNRDETAPAASSAPPTGGTSAAATRDRDLEDDLREAAQIVFYTAHEVGVSRDRMLRQVGLAKGLMGFADMVAPRHDISAATPTYWAVHAQHQRLIVYAPEPNWYIYICIALPRDGGVSATPSTPSGGGGGAKHSDKDKDKDKERDTKGEYVRDAPDGMLVAGLQRGYDDFCLRHGSLAAYLPPTGRTAGALEGFWTRFALAYEAAYVAPGPPEPILTWLGGWPATVASDGLVSALAELASDSGAESCAGVLTPSGPLGVSGPLGTDRDAAAFIRFLLSKLGSIAAAPAASKPAPKPERAHLGFGFGRRRAAEPARPASAAPTTSAGAAVADTGDRRTSWGLSPLSWVGLGSAPASRSASPMPPPPPPPETKPTTAAEKESKTPAAVPAAGNPRWPSLGAFGDAMGNVGAALGIAPSPKPGAHGDRAASPADRPGNKTYDESGGKPCDKPRDERGDAGDKPEDVTDSAATDDAKSDHVAKVAAEGGDEGPANEPETAATGAASQPAQGTEGGPTSEETTPRAADAHEDTPMAGTAGGEDVRSPPSLPAASPAGSTHSTASPPLALAPTDDTEADADGDAASIMTHTTAQSVASDLAAAAASDVELPWSTAQIYLGGTQRTVFWVMRERMLVFVLASVTDAPSPPTPPALGVFAAAARERRGHERRGSSGAMTRADKEHGSRDRHDRDHRAGDARPPDTTVYHSPSNMTTTAGPLDQSDAGTLAALRALTVSKGIAPVGEVYAQTPSGRFVVAKRVDAPAEAAAQPTPTTTNTRSEADTDATPTAETPSSAAALFAPPAAQAQALCATEELYGITARRDASLTDAERVVREFALVHPQFG